jgi:hypothetical protein
VSYEQDIPRWTYDELLKQREMLIKENENLGKLLQSGEQLRGQYVLQHALLTAEVQQLQQNLARAEKTLALIAKPALGGKIQQLIAKNYFAEKGEL